MKLQAAIRDKNLDRVAEIMRETTALAASFHKRYRLAKGQVEAFEKLQREQDDGKSSGSSWKAR